MLLAGLLLFPTLGMAAAPVNSWAAQRAALPPRLHERRHTEYRRERRERRAFAMGAATGGLVTVLCAVIAAWVLLFTPNHLVYVPNPIGHTHQQQTLHIAPFPVVAYPQDANATRPADRPALRPADRPALRPADRPALRPADRPALRPALRPADRPALRPADRPALDQP